MSDLYFDPDEHRYYLGGEELPSVTRVLQPLNDFSGIHPEVLQHAADRGTAVHKAVELFVLGTLDEDSLDPEVMPYFAAFKKFLAEMNPKVICSEHKLYHPEWKVAGTMDLLLELRGKPVFCDIKNTFAMSPTAGIQLVAYQEIAIACPDFNYDKKQCASALRAVLRLKKTGKYQYVIHEHAKYEHDLQTFKALLANVHTQALAKKAISEWKERNPK